MAKRFLTGIHCPNIRIDEVPILPTDGTNKAYVDQRMVPPGGLAGQALVKNSGTHWDVSWQTVSGGGSGGTPTLINIDMGSFLTPNGFIDCGSF